MNILKEMKKTKENINVSINVINLMNKLTLTKNAYQNVLVK